MDKRYNTFFRFREGLASTFLNGNRWKNVVLSSILYCQVLKVYNTIGLVPQNGSYIFKYVIMWLCAYWCLWIWDLLRKWSYVVINDLILIFYIVGDELSCKLVINQPLFMNNNALMLMSLSIFSAFSLLECEYIIPIWICLSSLLTYLKLS